MAPEGLTERVGRLEAELRSVEAELEEVRALLTTADDTGTTAPTPPPAVGGDAATPYGLSLAWQLLERGKMEAALVEAEAELGRMAGDPVALGELEAFARTAMWHAAGEHRRRAEALLARCAPAEDEEPATVAITPVPQVAAPAGERSRPDVQVEPVTWQEREPHPVSLDAGRGTDLGERLRAELTGARMFALAGGIVTLLGILFLFVLAANRGWVGSAARVAIGATASATVLVAGLALRHRFGRTTAGLAAVGTGLAGAYATLAAATVLYELLPAAGALVAAAGIATVGAAIAISWSSELLAGLAFVGAAAAPGALALDHGIEWPGTSFAVVVLAASVAVASTRRWLWLVSTVAGVAATQVLWLAAVAPADDQGAIATGVTAAFVLLWAAVAWQAPRGATLDGAAATFASSGTALALVMPLTVLHDASAAGLLLCLLALLFGGVALAESRRSLDLGWTIGAGALLLGGVGTASLLSGRSLTMVWAIESVVLMGLARKLGAPRFAFAALAYLSGAATHVLVAQVVPAWPRDAFDVPADAASGLLLVAGASLAGALLLPTRRAEAPSSGIAAALEPLWAALVSRRIAIRAVLAGGAAVAFVGGTAALVSGRALTLAAALASVIVAIGAARAAERRLSPFALGFLLFAAIHALTVEVPPSTLGLEPWQSATAPVASLLALTAAGLLVALLHRFEHGGLAFLGDPTGFERRVELLQLRGADVQRVLVVTSCAAAAWALGLLAIDAAYAPGQVTATALWAVLGMVVVVLASRGVRAAWELVGFGFLTFATLKALDFDWTRVGDRWSATAATVVAVALLVAGFALRWLDRSGRSLELVAILTGGIAAAIAFVGLERVLPLDTPGIGVAAFVIAALAAATGAVPYRRWRTGSPEPWLRVMANGYWAVALAMLLLGETLVVRSDRPATLALWALTGGVLGLAAGPLGEDRVWFAGLGVVCAAAGLTVALETTPDRLLQASAHPGSSLWVLAVACTAAWAIAATTPPHAWPGRAVTAAVAAGITLYGLSLGVLELAVRASGASVTTDFQRGHTALSALWGVGALVLYVVGLSRDRRELRLVGLTLFGLAVAKLFLYDLGTLSSITRALSFLAVGVILLTAGYFAERLVRSGDGGTGPTPLGGS